MPAEGDERLGPAGTSTAFRVVGDLQLYTTSMPAVSRSVSRVVPWLLTAVLATVWSLYFVVARLVLRIARAEDLPPLSDVRVAAEGSRRRLLRRLVPAGMHAAIAPVGLGLVAVVARSPYTHGNLEGHQPGYRRSPYAHVGMGAHTEPLPPVLDHDVSFSREVLPLLLAHAGPHVVLPKNSPPPAGVRLDSYEQIMAKKGLVVPGEPRRSLLVEVLMNPAMRMLPSLPPLPAAEIQLLVSWIAQGAKNN